MGLSISEVRKKFGLESSSQQALREQLRIVLITVPTGRAPRSEYSKTDLDRLLTAAQIVLVGNVAYKKIG